MYVSKTVTSVVCSQSLAQVADLAPLVHFHGHFLKTKKKRKISGLCSISTSPNKGWCPPLNPESTTSFVPGVEMHLQWP